MRLITLWALTAIFSSGTALAQETAAPAVSTQSIPAALSPALSQGVQMRFLTEEDGLKAWALRKDGKVSVVWTTPDGQRLFQENALIKERFDRLVSYQVQADTIFAQAIEAPAASVAVAAPKPVLAKAQPDRLPPQPMTVDGLWNDLLAAPGITFGEMKPGRPVLLMVAEPTCPFCRAMFQEMKPALDAGRFVLKIVVVAPPGSVTEGMAAAILERSPTDARDQWSDLMRGILPSGSYGAAYGESADAEGDQISPGLVALQANAALYHKWQIGGTPFSVYRTDGGIRVLTGKPRNVDSVLAVLK